MRSSIRVVFAENVQRAVVLLDTNARWNRNRQLTFRSFYLQLVTDVDFDTGRQRNGLLTNSRHETSFLPDPTQEFAADALLTSIAAGHHTTRSREDIHTKTAENTRDVAAADVDATAGTRYSLDIRNCGFVGRRVFEIKTNGPLRAVFGQFEVDDVALLFEDAGNFHLQLGRRDVNLLMLRLERVTHAGQHVGDGIG